MSSICYHKCSRSFTSDALLSIKLHLIQDHQRRALLTFSSINSNEPQRRQNGTRQHLHMYDSTKVTYSHLGHSPGTSAIHMRISHSPVNFMQRTKLNGHAWNSLLTTLSIQRALEDFPFLLKQSTVVPVQANFIF